MVNGVTHPAGEIEGTDLVRRIVLDASPEVVDGFQSSPIRLSGELEERKRLAARSLGFYLEFLDDALRGILPHDLVLIGAETGAGKTELAVNIARSNAQAGKAVYFFALEAEPKEIERRTKFALLVELALKDGNPGASTLNYPDWLMGGCEDVCGRYNDNADRVVAERFSTLHTFYRSTFGHEDIRREFTAIRDRADLIVLDHVHYVDVDDDNEQRGFKQTVKLIRSIALEMGKPVVLVAHLRKRDRRAAQVVPASDDFMGSSDLVKICTQVVQLAPAHCVEAAKWYLAPTFVHVPKDRRGGATGLVALCNFDLRYRCYAPGYTLGRVVKGGTEWQPLPVARVPRWAKHHRPLEGT